MSNNTTDTCVILLPGIPYNPLKNYDLIDHLTTQHDVYMIHYDGTWGSSGKFLKHNPVISVQDFISSLERGAFLNTTGSAYKNVFIIGTSFGGGLALTLKDYPILKAVCVLSPVISYKSVAGIDTLGEYLKTRHSDYYTFMSEDMQALITDQIISPKEQMTLQTNKLLVFAGEYDDQIPVNDILEFCSKNNIALHTLPMGHITLSKVNSDIYKKISLFFDKKNA
ncbi:MAG: hypothetical protein WC893_02115 [Candidatus Paceibacterota bacterium]